MILWWIWKNFCFYTNFRISWFTRISLDHSEKMRMHKIRLRRIFIHWLKFFDPLSKIIPLLFSFENESDFILQFTLEYIITGHMYFQFVRVYVRANSLNALIICYGHQQFNIKTFKRTYNSWQPKYIQSMKNSLRTYSTTWLRIQSGRHKI